MNIIIIGSYPPPYGGVSVHIKRMKQFLDEKNENVRVYTLNNLKVNIDNSIDILSTNKIRNFIDIIESNIIHFHYIDYNKILFLYILKFLNKKLILTIHNDRIKQYYSSLDLIGKLKFVSYLNTFFYIICVNKETKKYVEKILNIKKVKYLPAYINPYLNKSDFYILPQRVKEFINNNEFIICSNGSINPSIKPDVYGIDMLINLIYKLNNNNKKARLLFVLADRNKSLKATIYYKKLINNIKERGIENKFMMFKANDIEFYPILSKTNLFIRATNTDGYSLSVSESIYLDIPVIASDVCYRPNGTITFKSRDFEDLYKKTLMVMNNYNKYKENIKKINPKDFSSKLYNLYKKSIK